MRKFIVRNFALSYFITIFGKTWGALRASRIIFPLMCLSGYLVATNDDYTDITPLMWVVFFFTALSLFFGFVYFRWFPVKFSELDNSQKIQFGQARPHDLTSEEFVEWVKLSDKYNK